ncbi:DUF3823 domain-containing protein [Segetibacter koreensis]|uniref:DUF3823 domain-containing protein n=1 Tax=Segetibacter koreensis TaxID=398037 RepID=UPI00036BC4DD|nr:DUF3823 domain-containing protein [Segetibacter koreensis]
MKIRYYYIVLITLSIAVISCKKDNYDAPSSTLKGRLVYKGDSIGVERDQVPYELYQYGFGKVGAIASSFAQDGSYSALLFDGDYKLIIPGGQGPFMWKQTATGAPDSLAITLKGSQTLDLEVTPFYMIRNPQITGSAGSVSASFKVEKIVTDSVNQKDIERVSLYINKTQFVSGGDNIAAIDLGGADIADPNNITLNVTVPAIVPTQNYVFGRIGVKIAGVEDMIFSPVQKIQF